MPHTSKQTLLKVSFGETLVDEKNSNNAKTVLINHIWK